MSSSIQLNGTWQTNLATWFGCTLCAWVVFIIYEFRKQSSRSSLATSLPLFIHAWPAMVFSLAANEAENFHDSMLIWFILVVVLRYYRTIINLWFWFKYRPATFSDKCIFTPADCTVVLPTVGPDENPAFNDVVAAILVNRPARLIFSTNTDEATRKVKEALLDIRGDVTLGESSYQKENGLSALDVSTDFVVTNTQVSNKRTQVVNAFSNVISPITVLADDTAIWHSKFLKATLPAFASPKVGFVGTRKWVKRRKYMCDPRKTWLANKLTSYWDGFWNVIGALYLVRHNFEMRATYAADGGVFCISGRTSLIRTRIIVDPGFQTAFLNEYVLRIGDIFSGFGPVAADDDNFLTRWVINHSWNIRIQYSDEATITTNLGKYPKFLQQCQRWSRTTFRQNPIALFVDRTIWWKWPVTVWTTYFPWMFNAALFWDTLMVYLLTRTELYLSSDHRGLIITVFVGFIWLTKLIKTAPWFWKHPTDFFLYFFPIPAYPLFAYYHSLIKVWTAITLWDITWAGRKL